jgi:DNA (cytosine-5)-methyltransferase 1
MSRPRLLDLYCGAGGASAGYHRAGFDVLGVDHLPQPNYPFPFIEDDALEFLAWLVGVGRFAGEFDAIHASPPCQAFTAYGRTGLVGPYPDLIAATRALLEQSGLPWLIENVPGAPLHDPVVLCGTSLGIEVRRHRLFESSLPLLVPPCAHGQFFERKYPGSSNRPNGRTVCNVGEWRVPFDQQQAAMEIDWMTLEELSEAVPPRYTEVVGAQVLQQLQVAA